MAGSASGTEYYDPAFAWKTDAFSDTYVLNPFMSLVAE